MNLKSFKKTPSDALIVLRNRARAIGCKGETMKRYIAGHVSIARLAALVLTALCVLQAPLHASTFAEYIIILPPVGLAPGQSLRVTLFNPGGGPVRAEARIHDAGGNILLGDGSVRFLQAETFQSFDFKRSDIPLAGEENTGRLQLRGSVRLTSEAINRVVASVEVISISDGTSNTFLVGEVPPSPTGGAGMDVLIGGHTYDVLMGIVPGQTLRVTLFNPQSSRSDYPPSRVMLYESNGSLIAQSDELVIPPGEFRSFDFDRNVIPLAGDPGTNRVQVRIKPFFNFESERLPAAPSEDRLLSNLISFEVIDNSTGKTVVMSGQECLVFFLGGTAN